MENTPMTATQMDVATAKGNTLNWFEIPVTDMDRAKAFYQNIFQMGEMWPMEFDGIQMAGFPGDAGSGHLYGALAKGEWYKPSAEGALVYLNGNPDLALALDRVEAAGGKVVMPKMQITPEIGYMAMFMDTEGNRIGMHSNA